MVSGGISEGLIKSEVIAIFSSFWVVFICSLWKQIKYGDSEDAKAMAEVAAIEEQLNGVEKYAMYFMEQENAEVAAEQLRRAEVWICYVVRSIIV